jgi:hypothetical protein
MSAEAFLPQLPTVLVTLTTGVSSVVALNGGLPANTTACQVDNQTAAWVFVRFDSVNVQAVAPAVGTPQPGFFTAPGTTRVVRINPNAGYAAAIVTGSGNVSFTPGEGRL